jgi:hypothetical protein
MRAYTRGPTIVYSSIACDSTQIRPAHFEVFQQELQFSGNQHPFVGFTYSKDSASAPVDVSVLNDSVASISKFTSPLSSTRRRSIMPTEDCHAQSVIADLQAKLRASQADYASLQAAISHESPPLATTDKDAEIA